MTDMIEYIAKHGLEAKLNELINQCAAEQPADPLKYLAEKLAGEKKPASSARFCPPCPPPTLDVTPPPNAPGAAGMVCPCNLFGDLSFAELERRTVPAPYIPDITSPYDSSLYDEYDEDAEDEDEMTEEEKEERAHWESFNNDPKLFEGF